MSNDSKNLNIDLIDKYSIRFIKNNQTYYLNSSDNENSEYNLFNDENIKQIKDLNLIDKCFLKLTLQNDNFYILAADLTQTNIKMRMISGEIDKKYTPRLIDFEETVELIDRYRDYVKVGDNNKFANNFYNLSIYFNELNIILEDKEINDKKFLVPDFFNTEQSKNIDFKDNIFISNDLSIYTIIKKYNTYISFENENELNNTYINLKENKVELICQKRIEQNNTNNKIFDFNYNNSPFNNIYDFSFKFKYNLITNELEETFLKRIDIEKSYSFYQLIYKDEMITKEMFIDYMSEVAISDFYYFLRTKSNLKPFDIKDLQKSLLKLSSKEMLSKQNNDKKLIYFILENKNNQTNSYKNLNVIVNDRLDLMSLFSIKNTLFNFNELNIKQNTYGEEILFNVDDEISIAFPLDSVRNLTKGAIDFNKGLPYFSNNKYQLSFKNSFIELPKNEIPNDKEPIIFFVDYISNGGKMERYSLVLYNQTKSLINYSINYLTEFKTQNGSVVKENIFTTDSTIEVVNDVLEKSFQNFPLLKEHLQLEDLIYIKYPNNIIVLNLKQTKYFDKLIDIEEKEKYSESEYEFKFYTKYKTTFDLETGTGDRNFNLPIFVPMKKTNNVSSISGQEKSFILLNSIKDKNKVYFHHFNSKFESIIPNTPEIFTVNLNEGLTDIYSINLDGITINKEIEDLLYSSLYKVEKPNIKLIRNQNINSMMFGNNCKLSTITDTNFYLIDDGTNKDNQEAIKIFDRIKKDNMTINLNNTLSQEGLNDLFIIYNQNILFFDKDFKLIPKTLKIDLKKTENLEKSFLNNTEGNTNYIDGNSNLEKKIIIYKDKENMFVIDSNFVNLGNLTLEIKKDKKINFSF